VSRIPCVCGNEIRDTGNPSDDRAYFIASQDFENRFRKIDDLIDKLVSFLGEETDFDEIKKGIRETKFQVSRAVNYAHRTLYQCEKCGRLYLVDVEGRFPLLRFTPAYHAEEHRVLQPKIADHRKISLKGVWHIPPIGDFPQGTLSWGDNYSEEGYEKFSDWDALEARYYREFKRLSNKGILKHAILLKGDVYLHRWTVTDDEVN
jgi:hypothetical protein